MYQNPAELRRLPVASAGQPSALGVGQPEPPRAELLEQHAVLFAEVVDDARLPTVEPTRDGEDDEV